MKHKFYMLLFLLTVGVYLSCHSQAPAQPTNPDPPDQDITTSNDINLCADISDPNGDLMRVKYFGRTKTSAGSQKFTLVFLPDTQYYTEEPQGNHGGNIAMLNAQTTWIKNNRLARNIVYVGQLGDCVENGDFFEIEWQRAQAAFATIEDPVQTGLVHGVPFGICVGNHEQTPIGSPAGTTFFYNQYFGSSHFAGRSYYGGHHGTNNDNHYQLFSASGIDFLVISLEFDQTPGFSVADGALDWAESLVQNNPNKKVIVMTHWAISEDASFGPQGQAIYDRLKLYSNFSFLIGGHMSSINGGEARRTDIYNGNQVHSILSDYQHRNGGGNGLLRIYEFDPSQNKVSVQTYSPYIDNYETDASSQFELPFVMQPQLGVLNNIPSGTTPCLGWNDLVYNTTYEWGLQLYDGQNITTGPLWSFTTVDPLPVSLVEFLATMEADKVKLFWKTASEINNDRFEIERSADGNSYVKIGTIRGQGNSNNLNQYSFYDDRPLTGKNYYRLKQVDINGHYIYSLVRTVMTAAKPAWNVYPNPANKKSIDIYFSGKWKENVVIEFYDMSGRKLLQTTRNNTHNKIQVTTKFQPGLYIISLTGENNFSSQKMIVVSN
ncbi:T9SS type A sorting domain-containing protein [Terrimonas pollutisoli]|uniref:T9SS type A sorting domain-containing protein n=1 Tax=Terrimonas pollutisoli TaxID=3034147 RepID=UPI0023EC4682|nr:T9SS type A sorting domain-containing protein [Terrimonas sp. H1YJ31]